MFLKKITAGTATMLVAAALLLGPASPASAVTDYPIEMDKACAYFTGVGYAYAKALNPSDAYSWRCSTVPRPGYVQWSGTLNLTLWCQYKYLSGNAYAVRYSATDAYSWRCRV